MKVPRDLQKARVDFDRKRCCGTIKVVSPQVYERASYFGSACKSTSSRLNEVVEVSPVFVMCKTRTRIEVVLEKGVY